MSAARQSIFCAHQLRRELHCQKPRLHLLSGDGAFLLQVVSVQVRGSSLPCLHDTISPPKVSETAAYRQTKWRGEGLHGKTPVRIIEDYFKCGTPGTRNEVLS
jgi:hypothetical protein